MQAFQEKLAELRPQHGASNVSLKRRFSSSGAVGFSSDAQVSDVNMIDPLVLQDISREERKKFELQLQEEVGAMKRKYEAQLDEEKTAFIQSISEKEGFIAKLKSEIESLDRGKTSTEVFSIVCLFLHAFLSWLYFISFFWIYQL